MPRINFQLKTLFGMTVLIALVVGCVASDQRALAEVRRINEIVNAALAEVDGLKSSQISKNEFRNEFILFSSGTVSWDMDLGRQSQPRITLGWKSRLLFTAGPDISLAHRDTPMEQAFARQFLQLVEEHQLDVKVVVTN